MKELGKRERKMAEVAAAGCVYAHIRRASRSVGRMYDGATRGSGLRAGQLSVLITLEMAGRSTITKLGEYLVMDRTTLTRNLGPLEREDLIASAPGEDRRTRMVELTAAGRKMLTAALPRWERAHKNLIGALGEARTGRLLADLKKVVEVSWEG
jgi:DNA-binding MarR family transcriptional regulator